MPAEPVSEAELRALRTMAVNISLLKAGLERAKRAGFHAVNVDDTLKLLTAEVERVRAARDGKPLPDEPPPHPWLEAEQPIRMFVLETFREAREILVASTKELPADAKPIVDAFPAAYDAAVDYLAAVGDVRRGA